MKTYEAIWAKRSKRHRASKKAQARRRRRILRWRKEGWTYDRIGKHLGISRARVCQIALATK